MKPRKLTTRVVVIALVLALAAYYLIPTIRYEGLKRQESQLAQEVAEMMNVSFAFVIENLNKDNIVLRNRLASMEDIDPELNEDISAKLDILMGDLSDDLNKYRKSAIKQGLDLQGGMHLVLEVDLVQLMRNLARVRDNRLDELLNVIDERISADPSANFNDIVTAVFDENNIKLSQYFGEAGESNVTVLGFLSKQADDAINRSLEILNNRIDQFGVSEPSIHKQGARRIVLELPGVQDPSRARDLIGRTALLEFKLLSEPSKAQQFIQDVDKVLAAKFTGTVSNDAVSVEAPEETVVEPEDEDADALDLSAALGDDTTEATTIDTSAVEFGEEETPFTSLLRGVRGDIAVPGENLLEVKRMLAEPEVEKILPDGMQALWSAKPEVAGDGNEYHLLYIVNSNPELTGSALSDARVDISSGSNNPGRAGQSVVSLTLNRSGARKFARVTGANVNKRLAIVLDDNIYMAPVIRSKIPNGRAVVEGLENVEEANDLAIVLRAGALPTSVVIEEERTVGPSLGRDSIRKGIRSAVFGMIIVIIFMVIYYGMSGIIANVALILNIVLIFSGLAFFGAMGMGATLSLPGIAGIVLTIGMAVDANVLIFERIREELRTGKSVWHAINAGYDRAFTTILDANVTTLIAALVLLQFGSGPIKGFAITLAIGIVCSLFTAIVVTRLIFDYITSKRTLQQLSI